MTAHGEAIAILVFGMVVLTLLLGTNLLVDRRAMMALPPARRGEAVSYPATLAAAVGLACCAFGIHFLAFGRQTLRFPYTLALFGILLLVLGTRALRRRGSR